MRISEQIGMEPFDILAFRWAICYLGMNFITPVGCKYLSKASWKKLT